MSQIQCMNGHLFDPRRSSRCPVCGAAAAEGDTENGRTMPLNYGPTEFMFPGQAQMGTSESTMLHETDFLNVPGNGRQNVMDGSPALMPGVLLGNRYSISGLVETTDRNIVYTAWDTLMNRALLVREFFPFKLAIRSPGKAGVLLISANRQDEYIDGRNRFLDEAQNLIRFASQQNIVAVCDVFEANGTAYVVTEFLDGQTLDQTLHRQNGALPWDRAVKIACQLCEALRVLHSAGVLHRDVNPCAVTLLSNGTVKLSDFSAARFLNDAEYVPASPRPGFTAPELYVPGERQDPRTDVYSLAATLYCALTGRVPDDAVVRRNHDTLAAPAELDSRIPRKVSDAVMCALSPNPEMRFATVDNFKQALLCQAQETARQAPRKKKKGKLVAIILAAVLLTGAAAVGLVWFLTRDRVPAETPGAIVEVWYMKTGSSSQNRAKLAALKTAAEAFSVEHKGVTVEFTAQDPEDYAAALTEALGGDGAPDIFESTALTDDFLEEFAAPLAEPLEVLSENGWYTRKLCANTRYPTGIVAPVVYFNSALGEISGAETLEDLIDACQKQKSYLLVKLEAVDLYAALYGNEAADYTTDAALDSFLAGDVLLYLGDSSDLAAVEETLENVDTLAPGEETAVYRVGASWSVAKTKEGAPADALAFAAFLGSDAVQEELFGRADGVLPISKKGFETFLEDAEALKPLTDYLYRPYERPATDPETLLMEADQSKLEGLMAEAMFEFSFTDIPEDAWYKDAVADICARGLMNGTSADTFDPDAPILKSQAILVLYRLAGSPHMVPASPFIDFSDTGELGRAVTWAFSNGTINGSGDGMLHGNSSVNLETMSRILYNFAVSQGMDMSYDTSLVSYGDGDSISSWAEDAVCWCIDRGLFLVEVGGNIGPLVPVSRARFAFVVSRLLKILPEN